MANSRLINGTFSTVYFECVIYFRDKRKLVDRILIYDGS